MVKKNAKYFVGKTPSKMFLTGSECVFSLKCVFCKLTNLMFFFFLFFELKLHFKTALPLFLTHSFVPVSSIG